MDGLRLKEMRAAFAFLREMYADPDLKGFQSHILSALPGLVPADVISYNEVNPQARRNEYVSAPVVAAQYEPAFLRHMGDHPLITHYKETRDGRALRVSDLLPRRRYQRLALYNEFYRPRRMEYQVALTLPAPSPLVVGIALSRSRKDFSDRETRLLDLLRPHLVQAYRNAELMTRVREDLAAIQQALNELAYGLIVVTRQGRIRMANARAVKMLPKYCGGSAARGDRLPEELEHWVRHQVAAAAFPRSPRAPLVLEHGTRKLVVRIAGGADERLLLLEERTSVLSPHQLLVFGLTRREAEVMTWVVQGKTNAEIAGILGASPHTVIKHLQHVFEKLGVKTRTAAAARLFQTQA
jgi:DNA-binding CsgD family transcriptional regulator